MRLRLIFGAHSSRLCHDLYIEAELRELDFCFEVIYVAGLPSCYIGCRADGLCHESQSLADEEIVPADGEYGRRRLG